MIRRTTLAVGVLAVAVSAALAGAAGGGVLPVTGHFVEKGRQFSEVQIDAKGSRLAVSIVWNGAGRCVYANHHSKPTALTWPAAGAPLTAQSSEVVLKPNGSFAATQRPRSWNFGGDIETVTLAGHVAPDRSRIVGTVRAYVYFTSKGRGSSGGLFPETCHASLSFVATKGGATSPTPPPPAPKPPPAAPTDFAGTTAQGLQVTLTVSAGSKAVTDFSADVNLPCPDGSTEPAQVLFDQIPIAGGRFSASKSDGDATVQVDGQISGNTITGTVRDAAQTDVGTCDTGPVSFTVQKT